MIFSPFQQKCVLSANSQFRGRNTQPDICPMDSFHRQLAGGMLRLMEECGKTNLSDVLKVFEDTLGERKLTDHASEISDLWKQRQELMTLKIHDHVSVPFSPPPINA